MPPRSAGVVWLVSKLHDISDAIAARLANITQANGYTTDAGKHILRGKSQLNDSELPAARQYFGVISSGSEVGQRALQSVPIVIEVFATYTSDPERTAIGLLGDVAKAVEDTTDRDLGGLLRSPLTFESDEIIYAEAADCIVGARVTYNAALVRRYGGPG